MTPPADPACFELACGLRMPGTTLLPQLPVLLDFLPTLEYPNGPQALAEDEETKWRNESEAKRHKATSALPLDDLPDEILLMILSSAAEGCNTPKDFINMLLTSRRIHRLGSQPAVLKRLPLRALQVAPRDWSESAYQFLWRCAQCRNSAASYALGMISFYCLRRTGRGLRLLVESAVANNPDALYSLAIINFNGSGGPKEQRDVATGAVLCSQAAALGHTDALRELGHCLQDGYGVRRDLRHGRALLVKANMMDTSRTLQVSCCATARACPEQAQAAANELLMLEMGGPATASGHVAAATVHRAVQQQQQIQRRRASRRLSRSSSAPPEVLVQASPMEFLAGSGREFHQVQQGSHSDERQAHGHSGPEALLTSAMPAHPASAPTQCFCLPSITFPLEARHDGWVHNFMVEWHRLVEWGYAAGSSLEGDIGLKSLSQKDTKQCSNRLCGRIELRDHEFRCCSACTETRYCSRVCQAEDWKGGHKAVCQSIRSLQLGQPVQDLWHIGQVLGMGMQRPDVYEATDIVGMTVERE